jgi:type I restriction enzyme S subunit
MNGDKWLPVRKTYPIVSLGELCDLCSGITKGRKIDSMETIKVHYMAVANVQDGKLKLDNVKTIEATPEEIQRYRLLPGDLLLTEGGDPDKLGRGAIWNGEIEACIHQNHIFRARKASERVEMEYLARLVSSPYGKRYFLRQSKQTTGIASINMGQLKRFPVPLPPLEEQRRIAAILDKAALVSTHIDRVADLRLALKRSLFADLFRLSAQPAVTIGSDLPPSDGGWHWRLLTDVARLATGHTPDRRNQAYWGGDVPWITLGDIRELDGTLAISTKEMTTPEGIANSSAVLLPKGTVCFSRTASVGFSTIMGTEMSTSQDFVNWVCGPELLPEYLMNALIFSRARLRSLSTGSTHKTIYFSTVEQFRVLLPPVDLQTRFCQLISKVDSMPLVNSSALANGLKQSLVAGIFSSAD